MAKIGYGYGSEWHLMRFMGRHRELLETIIRKAIDVAEGSFRWHDFMFSKKKTAPDIEVKGLSFLGKNRQVDGYIKGWSNTQSWDAVFELDNIIYLVEAKAHIEEMKDNEIDKHGGDSKEDIKNFIYENLKQQNISIKKEKCLGPYYQLANRLATAAFLKNKGFEARCLYIYFLNGYEKKNDNKSVASPEIYLDEIHNEIADLGLNQDELKPLLYHVFIDAKTGDLINPKHQ